MKHVSKTTLYRTAVTFQKDKQPWHFHILTPDCRLNNSTQYALVLENSATHELLVNYSEKPYLDIGQKLVQLLHGQDIVQEHPDTLPPPSASIQPMLTKAKELTAKNIFWHHHLLFPDCQYNPHPGKWTIIFEDPRSREFIESSTATEPKADLKHLETLFYSQKGN